MICWKCKKEIDVSQVSRSSECPLCKADLRCCRMCRHYEAGAHYDCKESVFDPVTDKERSNFCDFFQINENIKAGVSNSAGKNDAINAFNALFGD